MLSASLSPQGPQNEASGSGVSNPKPVLANMHVLEDDAARQRLLHPALDLGFTHFDTARFALARRPLGSVIVQTRITDRLNQPVGFAEEL